MRPRGRADARSAMTCRGCESRGLNRSSQRVTRHQALSIKEHVATSPSRRTVGFADHTRLTPALRLSSSASGPAPSQHASAATPAPDFHPSDIPHFQRQTTLQERRRRGSYPRNLMSPPPPPPILPLSRSPEPFTGRRAHTDSSEQEIGDGTRATSPSSWRSIPLPAQSSLRRMSADRWCTQSLLGARLGFASGSSVPVECPG
jgi:hypothetical protein